MNQESTTKTKNKIKKNKTPRGKDGPSLKVETQIDEIARETEFASVSKTPSDNPTPGKISCFSPTFLIATFFGIGKIPFMPGTFGSMAAFPLFIASHYLLCFVKNEASFYNLFITLTVVLFFLGQWAASSYMKKTGTDDPGAIVIDEVVAQLLVFFAGFAFFAPKIGLFDIIYGSGSPDSDAVTVSAIHEMFRTPSFLVAYIITLVPTYIIGFILFRIFDIWKPFPIRWCDKNIKGGFGVMFDDIFAAAYAMLALYLIILGFFYYFVPPQAEVHIAPSEIIQ